MIHIYACVGACNSMCMYVCLYVYVCVPMKQHILIVRV